MTYDPIRQFKGYLDFAGKVGLFAVRAARRAVVPPFEGVMIWRGIEEVGWKSLPLVLASRVFPQPARCGTDSPYAEFPGKVWRRGDDPYVSGGCLLQ